MLLSSDLRSLRRGACGLALGLCALGVLPGVAGAAVTIGSDLAGSTGKGTCDPDPCTVAQLAIPGRQVTSPIDGVIVRWRLANSDGTFALRVGRRSGAAGTGVSSSAPVTVGTLGPTTIETRLPIQTGDFIGVDLSATAGLGFKETPGAAEAVWIPPLGNGETRPPSSVNPGVENMFNADIEPDADRDGFGDETQDLCAKDASTQGLCRGPCSNDKRGTEGPDTVNGTDAGDNLFGLGGNDRITALNGDDCVFGGLGDDAAAGDAGNDRLQGEAGADRLGGGLGDDQLAGGDGDDQADGGLGADTLTGGAGRDVLFGSGGNDALSGEAGDDRLSDTNGADTLAGGPGRDRLNAGSGNDRLTGGAGNDTMGGGSNNDRLSGEAGNDSLRGEAGNDRIEGGRGNDKIDVGKGANRASGGGGRDDIRAANRRRDRITCGSGRDKVLADASDRVARDCERVTRAGGRR